MLGICCPHVAVFKRAWWTGVIGIKKSVGMPMSLQPTSTSLTPTALSNLLFAISALNMLSNDAMALLDTFYSCSKSISRRLVEYAREPRNNAYR